jgi:hypothetical protein
LCVCVRVCVWQAPVTLELRTQQRRHAAAVKIQCATRQRLARMCVGRMRLARGTQYMCVPTPRFCLQWELVSFCPVPVSFCSVLCLAVRVVGCWIVGCGLWVVCWPCLFCWCVLRPCVCMWRHERATRWGTLTVMCIYPLHALECLVHAPPLSSIPLPCAGIVAGRGGCGAAACGPDSTSSSVYRQPFPCNEWRAGVCGFWVPSNSAKPTRL